MQTVSGGHVLSLAWGSWPDCLRSVSQRYATLRLFRSHLCATGLLSAEMLGFMLPCFFCARELNLPSLLHACVYRLFLHRKLVSACAVWSAQIVPLAIII